MKGKKYTKLRDKDINKLSMITGISVLDLCKLISMRVLNVDRCVDALVLNDYNNLAKTGLYSKRQITPAICNEYDVSTSTINSLLYSKKVSIQYCNECEKPTKKSELKRNGGICDLCISKKIKL